MFSVLGLRFGFKIGFGVQGSSLSSSSISRFGFQVQALDLKK